MLDQAFEALKTYDWGSERNVLEPIHEAVITTRNDMAARKELETRLAAVLKTPISRDAKDFVCRKLMQIGSAVSVPTLSDLLVDKDLSHMARFALERNASAEAAQALRDALPKLTGSLKVGVISSLGQRRDAASVSLLAKSLMDGDQVIARAAAVALGSIRTAESAKALHEAKPAAAETLIAVTDAKLACAEGMLNAGNSGGAKAVYQSLLGDSQPKHVRIAATRGMLSCASKTS
ncbi:MAG: hypothetical protein ABL921_08320 [Pirellula sp.]